VSADASIDEIRSAYVERARRQHPDVAQVAVTPMAGNPSMAEINHAYHVLRRPHTRLEYDRSLRAKPSRNGDSGFDDARFGADFDDTGFDDTGFDDTGFDDAVRSPSPGARLAGRVLTPSGPARMPWKLMAVTAVVGSAVVLVSASLADAPADEVPDGILRVGSCVAIEANGDAREIACADADNQVVRLVLPTGSRCPPAYATHRDRLGLGTACVERVIRDAEPGVNG
jgi:hypothetical protein